MDDFGNAISNGNTNLEQHVAFLIDGLLFDQCYLYTYWAE